MFFPRYSNIYKGLKEVLDSRANNTNNPHQLGGVSGLSTWIRVISAAGDGLVLESIHKPESFETRYGNDTEPGIIGYALDMTTPVKIEGPGRGLRPSPIITGFKIDERQNGALKIINFTIRCFTIEQVNVVSKYFLEPGFRVLSEWGWNVSDSYNQRIGGGGAIDFCDIVKYNSWPTIKQKREDSKYQYDASLGIITGGSVKFGDSETYDIEVQTSGQGQVAEYMQVHLGGNNTDDSKETTAPSFPPEEIGKGKVGSTLFKQMFNALPTTKKTPQIKSWATNKDSRGIDWAYEGNFVNFDEEIKDYLLKSLTKGASIRNKSGSKLEIPSDTPLFDKERFIRFELAIAILNSYVVDLKQKKSSYCPESKTELLEIDISNTLIKAFPHMFSTDKSVLYIPNTQSPNFGLKQALVNSDDETPIKFINFENLSDTEYQANLHPLVDEAPGDERTNRNGSAHDPATGQSRPVPFAFPCLYDLEAGISDYKCDDSVQPIQEKAGFWGYLKDLYINFEFFCDALEKSNMNSRDVLFELLNAMSSACNSIWDFQLKIGPELNTEEGDQVLEIVDKTFSGYTPSEMIDGIDTFQARGTKSPFTSFSWDMNIPGAMQSSVMIKRATDGKVDGSGEGVPIPLFGSVFSDPNTLEDKVGTVLNELKSKSADSENANQEEEKVEAKSFELFTNKAAVYSRVQNRKGRIDIIDSVVDETKTTKDNGTIESLLCIGAWDDKQALKTVELIDRGLKEGVKGEVDKKYTSRVNPIPGLAKVDFTVHGVSGFKVGDMLQFDGIPLKYGPPSFYQVTKVAQDISGTQWLTSVTCDFRLIGEEE